MPPTDYAALLEKEPPREPIDYAALLDAGGEVRGSLASFVGQKELGPPGLKSSMARFDMAAARTGTERLRAFKKAFPEGDLFKVPAGVLLFREDPSKPFAKVDADFLEGGGREAINDIIEFFAPDIGAITGETLAAFGAVALAPETGGVSLLTLLPLMMVSAAGGEMAQEGIKELRGLRGPESDTLEQVSKRAAVQGLFALGGGLAGPALIRPAANVIRGAGLLGKRPGGEQAQRAAKELGLKNLPVNLVTDNPLVQKLGGQAGALLPTLSRYVDNLERELALKFRGGAAKESGSFEVLTAVERRETSNIIARLTRPKVSKTKAGEGIIRGIAQYDISSGARVTQAYALARSVETPRFDIVSALSEAIEVKAIARQIGPDGASVVRVADQIIDIAKRQIGADPSKLANLERQALAAGDESLLALVRKTAKKDLPEIPAQRIRRPDGTETVIEATDQLRFIRSQAWDLKVPATGEISRQPNALAGRLFRSLTATLKDPLNTSATFRARWANANQLAARRFSTREKIVLTQAAKSETPTQLAARLGNLADPANADNIKTLRSVLPNAEFRALQDSALTTLVDNPQGLTQALKNAVPETLRSLFSPSEIAQLKFVGKHFDTLGQAGLRKALNNHSRVTSAIANITTNQNTAAISTVRDIVKRNGGKNGAFGRLMRGGLMQYIWESSRVIEKGAMRVSFNKLRDTLQSLSKTGALRLLTSREIRFLNNTRKVQDLLRLMPDAGTSIQAAEAAAGARSLSLTALTTIIENFSVGRIMTNRLGQKIFIGSGGRTQIKKGAVLPLLGSIAAQVASDADGELIDRGLESLSVVFGVESTGP